MASTERSLGWATGVALTDGAAAYDTARMTAMEKNTLGNGILLTGSPGTYLAMTNTTTVLTIADGAAVINGYFYESNGSVTISSAGLAAATYSIVIIANTSGASLTVSANGAGTTVILNATTRAALVTTAQLITIGGAIGAANYITLGTIAVTAGNFATNIPYYPYATSQRFSHPSLYSNLSGGTATLTAINTDYQIANFSSSSQTPDNTIQINSTTGAINIFSSGMYLISVEVNFNAGTTGVRKLGITNVLPNYAISPTNFATLSAVYLTHMFYVGTGGGASFATAITAASTVVGQSVTSCNVTIKRI
jgi:hypothetical protein